MTHAITPRRGRVAMIVAAVILGCACTAPQTDDDRDDAAVPDAIVVGAGLAGLSAAIEMAGGGARVLVLDMNSVFGGHAIQSGGVAIIDSPMQAALGYHDSPELAYDDWVAYTEAPDRDWVRYYVTHSRTEIYDFLTSIGVEFERIMPSHGNSVPRFHMTHRRGLNLLRPLFVEALQHPAVAFRWNLVVTGLDTDQDRIVGVVGRDLRTGESVRFRSAAVVLATGGFQRNIDMVRESWPDDLPKPDRVLTGSGKFSLGLGHQIAEEAGAALIHVGRQYNNYNAIPDPRDASGNLGISAGNPHAVWINADGRRFVNPSALDRDVYRAVLNQPGGTYWAIFDHASRDHFRVGGADWADRPALAQQILSNPDLVKSAPTFEALAAQTGLPAAELAQEMARYNAFVEAGDDTDFGRFNAGEDVPHKIDTAPYYAVQFYPMAHKNMGGIAIDLHARALDADGRAIAGLFAAGEVTGSAGINGVAGLDGTFTGPAILTGRVAGRGVLRQLEAIETWGERRVEEHARRAAPNVREPAAADVAETWAATMDAAELREVVREDRDGYWHFQIVHRSVLEREYDCTSCHSGDVPMQAITTRAGWLAQAQTCQMCHLAPSFR
jgi:uncharacterized protein